MPQPSLHELIRRSAAANRAAEAEDRLAAAEAQASPGAGFGIPGVGDDFRGVPGHLRPRWATARVGPGKRGRVLRWFWASAKRGEWVVGERLPGERKVAAALGVSRDTVRAAMHELAAAGVVARGKRGQGWEVRDAGRAKSDI